MLHVCKLKMLISYMAANCHLSITTKSVYCKSSSSVPVSSSAELESSGTFHSIPLQVLVTTVYYTLLALLGTELWLRGNRNVFTHFTHTQTHTLLSFPYLVSLLSKKFSVHRVAHIHV